MAEWVRPDLRRLGFVWPVHRLVVRRRLAEAALQRPELDSSGALGLQGTQADIRASGNIPGAPGPLVERAAAGMEPTAHRRLRRRARWSSSRCDLRERAPRPRRG